jgi:HAD superfamily hydrolase (TIGR01662 family)
MKAPEFSVVIPTVGRPSLSVLLASLSEQVCRATEVVVVDDRPEPVPPLDSEVARFGGRVLRAGGHGPARARNIGWRNTTTPWVVFVDDDVVLPADWSEELIADLQGAAPDVGGIQGRLVVPLPTDRKPTDWERGTAGLASGRWLTADMAYRRSALEAVDGFDERFPRAFREDSDLALRVLAAGFRLDRGSRQAVHPVRPTTWLSSVRRQRGNADDALMRRLHGPTWPEAAEAPRGRTGRHLLTVTAAFAAAAFTLAGRRRAAAGAGATWAACAVEFAARRIAPGLKTPSEVSDMALSSVLIPFAAVWHRGMGTWRHRAAQPWRRPVRAVLFDRDGTLVHDVPYNGDPDLVEPVPDARPALDRLRDKGVHVGVLTNQSGVARGLLSRRQVDAVNQRVESILGPFATWQVCPHAPDAGCDCRKPRPGMVRAASRDLGIDPSELVVVGDIGADVAAAEAAGSRGVLVPNPTTRAEEIVSARWRAATLTDAVDQVLEGLR